MDTSLAGAVLYCEHCDRPVFITEAVYQHGRHVFCSRACAALYRREMEELIA